MWMADKETAKMEKLKKQITPARPRTSQRRKPAWRKTPYIANEPNFLASRTGTKRTFHATCSNFGASRKLASFGFVLPKIGFGLALGASGSRFCCKPRGRSECLFSPGSRRPRGNALQSVIPPALSAEAPVALTRNHTTRGRRLL